MLDSEDAASEELPTEGLAAGSESEEEPGIWGALGGVPKGGLSGFGAGGPRGFHRRGVFGFWTLGLGDFCRPGFVKFVLGRFSKVLISSFEGFSQGGYDQDSINRTELSVITKATPNGTAAQPRASGSGAQG